MIPYSRQHIIDADVDAVARVLRSDWLTQGPLVPRFERALADRCGASHAFALSSATAALHIACLALDLGPGDVLWTTPNTFVATANCARYCGADVDFVDIDPRTYNMCVDALDEKLRSAQVRNCLPKVVAPVDFAGQSCDMRRIRTLADRYGFRILEDASHAVGGAYEGRPVGDCRYADIAVFSFHPVKIITTGEGGMALTNDDTLAASMARLRTHGITRDPALMTGESDGPWYYQQIALGFNYRMTDIQAALGLSQVDRLDDFVARRRTLAEQYDKLLSGLPIRTPWQESETASAWHLYVVRISLDLVAKTRRRIFDAMRAAGIGVNVHYIPVHLQPYYRQLGFGPGMFPEAEKYYEEAITLPLFPMMTKAEQDTVVAALADALA
jgi:UDP-4-amino-4,6-dideoxy-N-acetyl-beta-L-altrosamine transaminase